MAKKTDFDNRNTVRISARIPEELGEVLSRVSRIEGKPKSYYVKKSLEFFLTNRLEDIEDYEEAERAYSEFVASGEKTILFSEIKKKYGL